MKIKPNNNLLLLLCVVALAVVCLLSVLSSVAHQP